MAGGDKKKQKEDQERIKRGEERSQGSEVAADCKEMEQGEN